MRRWLLIGGWYGALLVFASALGGLNGFLIALIAAIAVFLFMTAMSFVGPFVSSLARRHVGTRTHGARPR